MNHSCHDCENPADPEFTMDFTDVKSGAYIYWCSTCGPEAKAMNEALQKAFKTRPGFAADLEAAIDTVTKGH